MNQKKINMDHKELKLVSLYRLEPKRNDVCSVWIGKDNEGKEVRVWIAKVEDLTEADKSAEMEDLVKRGFKNIPSV